MLKMYWYEKQNTTDLLNPKLQYLLISNSDTLIHQPTPPEVQLPQHHISQQSLTKPNLSQLMDTKLHWPELNPNLSEPFQARLRLYFSIDWVGIITIEMCVSKEVSNVIHFKFSLIHYQIIIC